MDIDELIKALSGAILILAFQRQDGSAASFIHRCFRREAWREAGLLSRLGLLAALPLWPIALLLSAAFFTRCSGPAVRRAAGKRLSRQFAEQLGLAARFAIPPPWYYTFELHDDARRQRASEYLNRFEVKRGIFNFLRNYLGPGLGGSTPAISDKTLFAERCREHDLSTVPVLLTIGDGRVVGADVDRVELPEGDLFVKPRRGSGGRGASRWAYEEPGRYRNQDGLVLTAAALLDELKQRSGRDHYIVQPRARNHPAIADLSNGTLNTVRIMTCRNERGEIEATNAAFRMGQGRQAVVDNFHAGGIAAKVDIRTGILSPGSDGGMSVGAGIGWCEAHPDTGARFAGRTLPCWDALVALVCRAHALVFGDQVAIGWDVGLLPDGPALVEANKNPDLDIMQRTHREPLGNARLGQLLSFNLERALAVKYGARERGRAAREVP